MYLRSISSCVLRSGNISARFVYGFEVRPYESENSQFGRKDGQVEDDGCHKGGSRGRLRRTYVRPIDQSIIMKKRGRKEHTWWFERQEDGSWYVFKLRLIYFECA